MIRFRPVRNSISKSLMDEKIFCTLEDMRRHIHERFRIALQYVGDRKPLLPDHIRIGESRGNDSLTGYKNVRSVYVRGVRVGYCGEEETVNG